MRILLAEDDPNISTIAKMALEQLGGHSVELAEDGAIALNKAQKQKFDVIVLDEMMPNMNGIAASEQMQKTLLPCPPIIFLSAKSQQDDIDRFLHHGLGYLAKPFDPTVLSQQIEDLLKGGSK